MKLFFQGHDERYSVEQTLLILFPQERPVYPDTSPGGENELELTLFSAPQWYTAAALLRREGQCFHGRARVRRPPEGGEVLEKRQRRRALQRAFYRAAVTCLGQEPPWGMLSGVRPVKLPTRAMEAGATPAQAEAMLAQDYHVSPERRQLAMDCAAESLRVKGSLSPEECSLYVGIPFCPTRCAYCSFISASGSAKERIPAYLDGLLQEVETAGQAVTQAGGRIRSVYLGGGTPTTLDAAQLDRLLSAIRRQFPLVSGCEFTVEAGRPDTITAEKLAVLRDQGVGRISVNPQSLRDPVLQAIGRGHSAQDVRQAYALTRAAGFSAINMDLIAGLPQDSLEGFEETLEEVLAMAPENITVHTLALKRGARQDWDRLPQEAEVEAMLTTSRQRLRAAGYRPYYLYRQKFMTGAMENVGWCRDGFASVYNICMMEELHSVLALGAGGSSKQIGGGQVKRLTNPKYPQEYLRDLPRILEEKAAWRPVLDARFQQEITT